jgi:hypothetical protein
MDRNAEGISMTNSSRVTKGAASLLFGIRMLMPNVAFGQGVPQLQAFNFAPSTIDTSAGAAGVTVSFAATDTSAGVSYVEISFLDPFGVPLQRASAAVVPTQNVSGSQVITFPRFSTPGTWKIGTIFLSDKLGHTSVLTTNDVLAAGFPTTLIVKSASDSTPPSLTALSLSDTSIDTTSHSATVNLNFTATDDLAGVKSFQAAMRSPSGAASESANVSVTPALSVIGSATLTFPKLSEAGTWMLESVFLADAAGNTKTLDTASLAARDFPTSITVTSLKDLTPPTLKALNFISPVSIGNTGGIAALNFQVTDDLSGATTFQAAFTSPSGAVTLSGVASFPASTSANGIAVITVPRGSETGKWTLATVFLADSAGNTKTLATGDLVAANFPVNLVIAIGDTTPPIIVPTVTPSPGTTGWNTTIPVTVTWSVKDPESGISSSSGCDPSIKSSDTPSLTITCKATNGVGLTSSASVTLNIDATPPVISGLPAPGACILWPPNGKFVQVATVSAADALSGLAAGTLSVTGASNELQDPKNPDIVITRNSAGAFVVQLRADRLATGTGRIYTLNAQARDIAGNISNVTGSCTVPHDHSN